MELEYAVFPQSDAYSFPLWWIALFFFFVELLIYFLGDSMDLVFGSRTKLLAFKLVPYFVV